MAKSKSSKPSKPPTAQKNLFLAAILILSGVFFSTAFILFISLLPMFVAFFADTTKKKYKTLTVGAMNMAGTTPFLLELWTSDHTFEKATAIILDPLAITIVYAAAGAGYLIDWIVTLFVANLVYQKGLARVETIQARQAELIERWGIEVNGTLPLDSDGFPVDIPLLETQNP